MKTKEIKIHEFEDEADFDSPLYKRTIEHSGIFLARFKREIDFLLLIKKIGKPHSHSGSNNYVWDVKPSFGEYSKNVVRSQTMEEFTFHTDCSFEISRPPYVALYVIHEDTLGGGITRLIDFFDIAPNLDEMMKEILSQDFKTKIPREFMKDKEYSVAPIFLEKNRIAYRRECIIESELSKEKIAVLDNLDTLINHQRPNYSFVLPRNFVLFLDNTRILHARTEIKDENRHLKRVRYF